MNDFYLFCLYCSVAAFVLLITGRFLLRGSFLLPITMWIISVNLIIAIMAFYTGMKGLIHLLWAIPVASVGIIGTFIYLIQNIKNPILHVNELLKEVAQGKTTVDLHNNQIRSRHEIADLMNAFGAYIQMLQEIDEFASKVGAGDLSAQYNLRGTDDSLGRSLITMRENLKMGIMDVQRVAEEVANHGNLEAQINQATKKGAWKDLSQSVNSLINAIVSPILQFNTIVDKLSKGDFTARYTVEEVGDLARLRENLNMALNQIDQTLGLVASNSESIKSSTNEMTMTSEEMNVTTSEIATSSSEMSSGAQTQLRKIDDMSRLFELLNSASEKMGNRARAIFDATRNGAELSEKGKQVSGEVAESVKEIKQYAQTVNHSVEALNARSKEISNVLSVISEISSQTNLLALNAAIEAAQAGEAGRGFAVVAEEIRKLAEHSKSSATEIEELVSNVQNETAEVDTAIKEMSGRINTGETQSQGATATFLQIYESSHDTLNLSKQILEDTDEQITKMNDAFSLTQNVVVISEETATGTEQVSASTAELSSAMQTIKDKLIYFESMAESMADATGQFVFSNSN